MNDNEIVDSGFTAIINAPSDKIDIPIWCFNVPEQEYRSCSPAHVSAGFTTAPDGKRMSINIEIIGLMMGAALRRDARTEGLSETRFKVRRLHADWTNDHSRYM
jgi:hypothetical protein